MTAAAPRFSIILPAHDAAGWIDGALDSALGQAGPSFELLLVDDGSVDDSAARARRRGDDRLRIFRTAACHGPGPARNLALEAARGEWLLFLDSDDRLRPGALARLAAFLDQPGNAGCDLVCHRTPGRPLPPADRTERLHRYLALQMDGSVLYTAARRRLLEAHRLRFAGGLHEDVDLLFRLHWHAGQVGLLDAVLYDKRARPGSIVGRISVAHLDGLFRAWAEIADLLRAEDPQGAPGWLASWRTGLVGVLATRLRAIRQLAGTAEQEAVLQQALHAHWCALADSVGGVRLDAAHTQYFQLARAFLAAMQPPRAEPAALAARIDAILAASWSCHDLHHAAFLAPDQVRTCCKRFFVEGERRGDVALFDVAADAPPTPARILAAKRALHAAINRGEATPCSGCPFLEFRDWGALERLELRTLSLEQHSVCNLHCSYCSDTWYGGARSRYDLAALVDSLLDQGAIDAQATVVWGGGEPLLDAAFEPVLLRLAERLPAVTQRVLSNAVRRSPALLRLLGEGRASLTTSLDAGTGETFARVRGRDRLQRVLRNLQAYAAARPDAVTLKYIFTEDNATLAEVRAFVARLQEAGLLGCALQVSHDFRQATVPPQHLLPIAALYGLLVQAGGRVVFLDDLLRQRLVGLGETELAALRRGLAAEGLDRLLLDAETHPDYAIWGAGWQARHLIEKSRFLRRRRPAFLVDSTAARIGTDFMGLPVRDPRSLLECDMPVLIAAAQAYPAIHREFLRLGLPERRLVTGLVL